MTTISKGALTQTEVHSKGADSKGAENKQFHSKNLKFIIHIGLLGQTPAGHGFNELQSHGVSSQEIN